MAPIAHLWLLQGQRKVTVETRLAIPEESVQWIMKGYWTSNSFQVKSWVWLCVCVWKSGRICCWRGITLIIKCSHYSPFLVWLCGMDTHINGSVSNTSELTINCGMILCFQSYFAFTWDPCFLNGPVRVMQRAANTWVSFFLEWCRSPAI